MSRKRAKKAASAKPASAKPASAKPAPATPSPEASATAVAPITPPDVVDAGDTMAAHFFSTPAVSYDEPLPVEAEPVVPRRATVSPERRRYLGRVVGGAVAVSFAICVAAGVRVATVHAATGDAPRRSEMAQAVQPSVEVVPPTQPPAPVEVVAAAAPSPDPAPSPEPARSPDPAPAPEPPRSPEPAAQESPPAIAAASPAPPAPSAEGVAPAAAPVENDPAAARDAKRASQRALERGDAKASIAAGERSVALDPTDAEAWLVLGAAYQTKGTLSEARRCFSACVHEAKRGPRGECAALAH